jgi:hypothetical protein
VGLAGARAGAAAAGEDARGEKLGAAAAAAGAEAGAAIAGEGAAIAGEGARAAAVELAAVLSAIEGELVAVAAFACEEDAGIGGIKGIGAVAVSTGPAGGTGPGGGIVSRATLRSPVRRRRCIRGMLSRIGDLQRDCERARVRGGLLRCGSRTRGRRRYKGRRAELRWPKAVVS